MGISLQPATFETGEPETVSPPELAYRPDIDGLRAVAIISVVIFHSAPKELPGGFTGVDIFFVISGFLISGIILRRLARGDFRWTEFYARRIKRIFPALVTMIGITWLLGKVLLLPDEFQVLGKHMLAGAGFSLNLVLFQDTKEYFGAISTPLIHLWSLGVEEQFYFLWPLCLMATWKLARWQLAVIAGIAATSFGLNVYSISAHPLASFYLPSNRLWELSMGACLALVDVRTETSYRLRSTLHGKFHRILRPLFSANLRSIAGGSFIIVSLSLINSGTAFPGWWALAPCTGTFLLIAAGPDAWINRRVLSHPIMVCIGLISYPLYLWHWPLLSFAHIADWRGFTVPVKLVSIALSCLLSTVTYKYIENPIRHSRRNLHWTVILGSAIASCACIGYLTFIQKIPSRSIPPNVSPFLQAALEGDPYPDQEGYLTIGEGPKETIFIGDSTLAQYYTRIAKTLADHSDLRRQVVFAWRAGCAPIPELALASPKDCQQLLQTAVERAKDPRVDTVVIGFCWYAYFIGILDDDHVGEGGPLVPLTDDALNHIREAISELVSAHKRVFLVMQGPLDPGFAPRQMILRGFASPGFHIDARSAARGSMEAAFAPFRSKLLKIADETGAHVIDPIAALCGTSMCSAVSREGYPIYHDSFHLRKAYIEDYVKYMDVTLQPPTGISNPNVSNNDHRFDSLPPVDSATR